MSTLEECLLVMNWTWKKSKCMASTMTIPSLFINPLWTICCIAWEEINSYQSLRYSIIPCLDLSLYTNLLPCIHSLMTSVWP